MSGHGGVFEKYTNLQKELMLMVEYINETRRTLGSMKGALPGASDILSGVAETMERATHDILGMVEKMMDADMAVQPAIDQAKAACANDPTALAAIEAIAAAADARMASHTEIMTALSFQDLTCQALNKIGTTMVEIEQRMVRLVEREAPGAAQDLSNGPGFSGIMRLKEAQLGGGRQGLVDEMLKGR